MKGAATPAARTMVEVKEKGEKKGQEKSIGIDEIEIVARQFSLFRIQEQNLD